MIRVEGQTDRMDGWTQGWMDTVHWVGRAERKHKWSYSAPFWSLQDCNTKSWSV